MKIFNPKSQHSDNQVILLQDVEVVPGMIKKKGTLLEVTRDKMMEWIDLEWAQHPSRVPGLNVDKYIKAQEKKARRQKKYTTSHHEGENEGNESQTNKI